MKFNKAFAFAVLMSISPAHLIMAKSTTGFPMVATQAGEYKFESVDVSSLYSIEASQMSQRELKQIEILTDSIKTLEAQYKTIITKDFQALKSAATGGNRVFKRVDGSFEDLYSKFDSFQNAKKLFLISLNNLEQLPKSLSSSEMTLIHGEQAKYPAYINKNAFDSIVSSFKEQLLSIDEATSNLNYKLETSESGVEFISFSELENYRAKLFFSTGELEQMRDEANKLRARMSKDERAIDSTFSKKIMEEMQTFVKVWGTDRSFTVKEFNEDQFSEDFASLEKYFYMRSALRIMYKIPIGSYAIQHEKQAFNLDVLRSDTKMVKLQSTPIRSSTDLKRTKDSLINAIAILEMRAASQPLSTDKEARELGSQITELFSSDATLMQKLMGARSIITGNMPLVHTNLAVLKLMLIDVQEELHMQEFGGEMKVKLSHKGRYGSVEDTQRFSSVKEGLVSIYQGKNRKKLDVDSVENTLTLVSSSLKNMNAKISEANVIEEKIERMEKLTERGQNGFEVDLDF